MYLINWGEPEQAPVLSVEHGTFVACKKISLKNRIVPHLVADEMVRTSCTQNFSEQTV